MKIWIILFLLTACELLVVSEDIINDRKYTVSFFQFNPKDLDIWGKGHMKKDMKRSAIEAANNTSINSTTLNTDNVTASNYSKETSSVVNNTAPVTETNLKNGTILKVINNTDVMLHENSTTPAFANDTDINIMNTLIAMSVNNKTAGDRSKLKGEDNIGHEGKTGSQVKENKSSQNSSIYEGTSVTNKTISPKSKIAVRVAHAVRKDDTLNPNPKPSEHEAALNLLHVAEGKGMHSPIIHKSISKHTVNTDNSETTKTNKISMEKNVKSPEKARLAKHIIKEGAKQIQPSTNRVGPVNISNKEIKGIVDEKIKRKENVHGGNANQSDEKKLKHRQNIAKFVPLYKTTPKDHTLSFQLGSLKHPKHDMHPKCHACPLNSTYKECVKKSTLQDCSNGLNNICFTKSTKKQGVITYQMGCTDHDKCTTARAFPCKDGSEHCFTCCQFDRCNSSPHHGDYELDELNLDELSTEIMKSKDAATVNLDTPSSTEKNNGSWMAYACSILIIICMQ